MVDWDNLRVFLSAVRAGNYTSAAKMLRVDRTTIGRKIDRLEQELGAPVFEQGEDGHHPTRTGLRALELAAEIETLVERFLADIETAASEAVIPLRVAVAAELGAELMPELADFSRAHPQVRLRIISHPDPGRMVLQRKADVAVCLADQAPDHLRGRRIATLRQAPYATTRYVEWRGRGLPPQDYDWVRCSSWSQLPIMRRWDAIFCDHVAVAANVDNWSGLKGAVESDLGAAFLWTFVADRDPDLCLIAPADERLGVDMWLLVRDDVPIERAARSFIDDFGSALSERLNRAPQS